MVELDNLFTFSPVCATLKAVFQKEGQEEDCLSAVVLLWHFWASWSLWQGEEQDDNSELDTLSGKKVKAGEQETSERMRGCYQQLCEPNLRSEEIKSFLYIHRNDFLVFVKLRQSESC